MSDRGDPVEHRLDELLHSLRDDAPAPGRTLVPGIVARARWQAPVREAVRLVGHLAAGAGDAIRLVLGRRSPRRGPGA